jgi:hypothetical protein
VTTSLKIKYSQVAGKLFQERGFKKTMHEEIFININMTIVQIELIGVASSAC